MPLTASLQSSRDESDLALSNAPPLVYDGPLELDIKVEGTRFKVPLPKSGLDNIRYRRRVKLACENDPHTRVAVYNLCAQNSADSFIYWVNTFGWTFVQLDWDPGGEGKAVFGDGSNVPFITWPCQDNFARELHDCIASGKHVCIKKSRDMGASWLVLTMFHWFWQFQKNATFMEVSRKEALVDREGDSDTLFWKHDYLHKMQPDWLTPSRTRNRLAIVNKENNSQIMGASTTAEVGHGGRKIAMLFDEAARMRDLQPIWEGARDTTGCRIVLSTSRGLGMFSKLSRSQAVYQIRLPYWMHPMKGQGRHVGAHPFHGRPCVTNDYHNYRCETAVTRREVYENLDMDDAGSGDQFFDSVSLIWQQAACAQDPWYQLDIKVSDDHDRDVTLANGRVQHLRVVHNLRGELKLWCELEKCVVKGVEIWRPQQFGKTYVIGCDIGKGLGQSNSVAYIIDRETNEQIGEFASAEHTPEEFARIVCALGWWFGGQQRGCAFVGWEANGPGEVFGKITRKLRYPWIYFERKRRTRSDQGTERYGWYSTEDSKMEILGVFRDRIATGEHIVRSEATLGEAERYVYYESGLIGAGELEEESPRARGTHGDRVIAGGVAVHILPYTERCKPPTRVAERGSPAWRRQEADRRKKREAASERGA